MVCGALAREVPEAGGTEASEILLRLLVLEKLGSVALGLGERDEPLGFRVSRDPISPTLVATHALDLSRLPRVRPNVSMACHTT